jgi:hypothetical protein
MCTTSHAHGVDEKCLRSLLLDTATRFSICIGNKSVYVCVAPITYVRAHFIFCRGKLKHPCSKDKVYSCTRSAAESSQPRAKPAGYGECQHLCCVNSMQIRNLFLHNGCFNFVQQIVKCALRSVNLKSNIKSNDDVRICIEYFPIDAHVWCVWYRNLRSVSSGQWTTRVFHRISGVDYAIKHVPNIDRTCRYFVYRLH